MTIILKKKTEYLIVGDDEIQDWRSRTTNKKLRDINFLNICRNALSYNGKNVDYMNKID